ncbi:hypothetical protein JCM11641_000291 [Rhodosporidiobolus odoratus]
MPNPPPPPPPLQPNGPPPSLRKFSLIPPPAPNAPMVVTASGTGPVTPYELAQLRSNLVMSQMLARERLSVRDGNKQQLAERQAHEKRTAEEQARVKDAERRRKREEEERKERERAEKVEKERLEREKEERRRAKQAEKEDQERRSQEASKAKEKQRALDVISLVHANEAKRPSRGDGNGDTVIGDANSLSTPSSSLHTPSAPLSKLASQAGRSTAASSPELNDDSTQPRAPRRSHEKKKRKRESVLDSDGSDSEKGDQPLLQKVRKLESQTPSSNLASPAASQAAPTPLSSRPIPPGTKGISIAERKLKEDRFQKHSIPIKPPPAGGASAFYVPSSSLVPPKPPVIPPAPTPKRQADVTGDFSIAKPGQQIAHTTFQNWVDAYLRPFGEDDLAFLAAKPEDIAPYLIPPLGKHFLDQWEAEDAEGPSAACRDSSHSHPNTSLEPPVLPRLRPDSLTEDALAMENVFLGPLSERLMAALAVDENGYGASAVDGDDDLRATERGPVPPKLPMDAVDLEERIKRELRFIGILPEDEVDWSAREDDEISSSLRACQRLLHQQTELNEARKAALMSLVKDRMAYQDYETARDAQERVIEQGWTKRTRVDTKKQKKKKDKDKRTGTAKEPAGVNDDPSKQPIPLELLEAVEKRNRLVGAFQPFFEEEENGRYYGLPERSVYDGLEVGEEDDEDDVLPLPSAVAGPSYHQQQQL